MNERIRQLADKIWEEKYWTNPNTDRLLPAQLNRFAELIVRECVEICSSEDWEDQQGWGKLYAHKIKKHFEVK